MKRLKRVEKILLSLIAMAIICGISTFVNATEPDVNGIIDINVINTEKKEETKKTEENNSNISNVNNNNANTNKETSLPKTGANDTTMWVIIGGCVVLAIYTYKKVKDYNV